MNDEENDLQNVQRELDTPASHIHEILKGLNANFAKLLPRQPELDITGAFISKILNDPISGDDAVKQVQGMRLAPQPERA